MAQEPQFSFGVPDVSQAIQGATNIPSGLTDPAKIGTPDLSAMPSPTKPGSLYESLGIPAPPKFISPPVVKADDFIARQEKALKPERTKLEELSKRLGTFEGEKAQNEADTRVAAAEGRLAASEKMIKDMELPELRKSIKDTAEKMSKPFVPTAENAQDIATLFSLVNVVGFDIFSAVSLIDLRSSGSSISLIIFSDAAKRPSAAATLVSASF